MTLKISEYGDCIYDEDYVLQLLYKDPTLDISKIILDDKSIYNTSIENTGLDFPKTKTFENKKISLKEFDEKNIADWHMPEEYKDLDIRNYLLDRCNNEVEKQRVEDEYKIFSEKGFTKVLQFLVYFIDTLRQHNIVWGVGRGSSVSSFCLFLIGVHKINPLLYDLDYREFLR